MRARSSSASGRGRLRHDLAQRVGGGEQRTRNHPLRSREFIRARQSNAAHRASGTTVGRHHLTHPPLSPRAKTRGPTHPPRGLRDGSRIKCGMTPSVWRMRWKAPRPAPPAGATCALHRRRGRVLPRVAGEGDRRRRWRGRPTRRALLILPRSAGQGDHAQRGGGAPNPAAVAHTPSTARLRPDPALLPPPSRATAWFTSTRGGCPCKSHCG